MILFGGMMQITVMRLPKSKTKSMRANPQEISYLYAAEDIN